MVLYSSILCPLFLHRHEEKQKHWQQWCGRKSSMVREAHGHPKSRKIRILDLMCLQINEMPKYLGIHPQRGGVWLWEGGIIFFVMAPCPVIIKSSKTKNQSESGTHKQTGLIQGGSTIKYDLFEWCDPVIKSEYSEKFVILAIIFLSHRFEDKNHNMSKWDCVFWDQKALGAIGLRNKQSMVGSWKFRLREKLHERHVVSPCRRAPCFTFLNIKRLVGGCSKNGNVTVKIILS